MSDCLITGVQLNSSEEATCKASTVMVQCSHAVQPGLLVTVTGSPQHFMLELHYIAELTGCVLNQVLAILQSLKVPKLL